MNGELERVVLTYLYLQIGKTIAKSNDSAMIDLSKVSKLADKKCLQACIVDKLCGRCDARIYSE